MDPSASEAIILPNETFPSHSASAWIAGPPAIANNADLVLEVVRDLLATLDIFTFDTIMSDQPRDYRLTESGFRSLSNAIARGQVGSLVLASENLPYDIDLHSPEVLELRRVHGDQMARLILDVRDSQGGGSAMVSIELGTGTRDVDPAFQIGIDTWGRTTESQVESATRLTGFVRRWVVPLRAAAAFVSGNQADRSGRTEFEKTHRLTSMTSWSEAQQRLRGVFWCMFLGSAQCEALGGQTSVLAAAPAPISEPLGDGVWLQLGTSPSTGSLEHEPIAEFLRPLLLKPRLPMPAVPGVTASHQAEPTETAPTGIDPVPVTWLEPPDEDLILNIHVAPPITESARAAIVDVINKWYTVGFAGGYGGAGFHVLLPPSVDEVSGVVRCLVDPGDADQERAVDALARWLASITAAEVRSLALGLEVEE